MVDFLRQSVERLEPPTCSSCNIKMIWYRSIRPTAQQNLEQIVHYFQCPSCNGVAEVTTRLSGDGNGHEPPRLAVPARPQPPDPRIGGAAV